MWSRGDRHRPHPALHVLPRLRLPRLARSPTSDTISVKGGSLDQPVNLTAAIHIWTARKLPGVVIPQGAAQFPGEPP